MVDRPPISISTHHIPSTLPSHLDFPGFLVQITRLAANSYIIWVGVGRAPSPIDRAEGGLDVSRGHNEMGGLERAQGGVEVGGSKYMGKDFACAMPTPIASHPVASTSLLHSSSASPSSSNPMSSSSSDSRALRIAQRLAKRFNSQMYLSLDIPSGQELLNTLSGSGSGGGMGNSLDAGAGMVDPLMNKMTIGLEKGLVTLLEEVVL